MVGKNYYPISVSECKLSSDMHVLRKPCVLGDLPVVIVVEVITDL